MASTCKPAEWDAALYDRRFSCIPSYGKDLLPLLDPQPGQCILDLGCGTGRLTAQIAKLGADVLGVDRSATMIAEACTRHPSLRFEVMDATKLALDQSFDSVFSNAVLHWIPEADQVIEGVARVLKPGGKFVLEMGGNGNIAAVRRALEAAFAALDLSYLSARSPWYFPGIGEYTALLDARGFCTKFAVLFDRPTPLDPGEDAFRAWLEVFGKDFLEGLTPDTRNRVIRTAEERARPDLYSGGNWTIDYVRLRVVAVRV